MQPGRFRRRTRAVPITWFFLRTPQAGDKQAVQVGRPSHHGWTAAPTREALPRCALVLLLSRGKGHQLLARPSSEWRSCPARRHPRSPRSTSRHPAARSRAAPLAQSRLTLELRPSGREDHRRLVQPSPAWRSLPIRRHQPSRVPGPIILLGDDGQLHWFPTDPAVQDGQVVVRGKPAPLTGLHLRRFFHRSPIPDEGYHPPCGPTPFCTHAATPSPRSSAPIDYRPRHRPHQEPPPTEQVMPRLRE